MRLTLRCWMAAGLWAALLVVAPAAAQQRQQRPRSFQEQQARLTQRFLDHATAELNLSTTQRSGLEGVLDEMMERRRDIVRRQVKLRQEIRDALTDPSTGDGEFLRLSEEATAIKRLELDLLETQSQRLGEVLTPRQALRFMVMQERLARQVEQMRRRRDQ